MNYSAEIKVKGDGDRIIKCFEPEVGKRDRSGFDIQKSDDGCVFKIEATDSVALRATLNSITKLLTVYENIEKVE